MTDTIPAEIIADRRVYFGALEYKAMARQSLICQGILEFAIDKFPAQGDGLVGRSTHETIKKPYITRRNCNGKYSSARISRQSLKRSWQCKSEGGENPRMQVNYVPCKSREVMEIAYWQNADGPILIPVHRAQFIDVSFMMDDKTEHSCKTQDATAKKRGGLASRLCLAKRLPSRRISLTRKGFSGEVQSGSGRTYRDMTSGFSKPTPGDSPVMGTPKQN
jgi:hypothetical protein